MARWSLRRRPRPEHQLGEYTEPSFRGALVMLVVSLLIVALLWLAYSWALNQPNVHDPNGFVDRAAGDARRGIDQVAAGDTVGIVANRLRQSRTVVR